jgi:hypothetical protein
MDEALIKAKVDEFAKWQKLADECKTELEKLKGFFQKLGTEELQDKKTKQTEFWGTKNAKVIVTNSESLKVVSHTFLSKTLGDVLKDFAKEEPNYKYSEPFKRILTAIFQGTYVVDQSLDDVIGQITPDATVRKVLKKKLKGNWEKDVATLKNIGLTQKHAEHYAFFVQEAVNYAKIVQLLETAGHQKDSPTFEVALQAIKNAVIVEEGIKVGVQTEEIA